MTWIEYRRRWHALRAHIDAAEAIWERDRHSIVYRRWAWAVRDVVDKHQTALWQEYCRTAEPD